jgi:hypothetical protein
MAAAPLLSLVAGIALLLQGTSTPIRAPLVSARVTPESPAIGEPITVELRVRAPIGSEIRFPALPDSAEAVEPLDPRAMRDASTATLVDRTAVYRLIAWDTGSRVLRFEDVTVRANGAEQRYRVSLPTLRIRSVLPADSTGRVPRPGRAPLEMATGWWRFWVALAVVLLLALWGWRAWRRKRAHVVPEGPDAGVLAREAFEHAAQLGLIEAGEPGRFALTHVGVMRHYLAGRFPQAHPSLTPREVAAALVGAEFPVLPERVVDLLLRSEPIAFAAAPVTVEEARAIGTEARAIVQDVETALIARREVAANGKKPRRKIRRRPL